MISLDILNFYLLFSFAHPICMQLSDFIPSRLHVTSAAFYQSLSPPGGLLRPTSVISSCNSGSLRDDQYWTSIGRTVQS